MTMLKTIQDVRDMKWAGNHHSDSDKFRAVDNFIFANLANREVCKEALDIAAKNGMGVDEKINDELFDEYVAEIRHARARKGRKA